MGIDGFAQETRTFKGESRVVHYRRNGGPGVVLVHEIPGITPQVAALGNRIADAGFSVAMPSLFGTDGAPDTPAALIEAVARLCVSREFAVFAANGSSPMVDWLRALCVDFHSELGLGGVGAVGLCLTGGFALSLTVGTGGVVKAPVMGEPSLPFALPLTDNAAAMHLSDAEREVIGAQGTPVIALRFTSDWICKKERFDSYEALLGARLTRIEIASPDPAYNISANAHAVLTNDFQDVPGHPTTLAFDRVIEFLKRNLP